MSAKYFTYESHGASLMPRGSTPGSQTMPSSRCPLKRMLITHPEEISAEVVTEVLDVVVLPSTGADTLAQADKVARKGRVEKRRKAQSKHLEREAVEREEVETATDVVDAAVKRDSEGVELVAHSVVDNDEVIVSETVTEAGLTLPPADVEFWSPHPRFRCRSHPYLVLFSVCVLVLRCFFFFFKCRVWACRCLSLTTSFSLCVRSRCASKQTSI